MKKNILILIFLSVVNYLLAQQPQKVKDTIVEKNSFKTKRFSYLDAIVADSLPNLWIVTMDKSGSMTVSARGGVKENLNYVIRMLKESVYPYINFKKDHFVFYNTGIVNRGEEFDEVFKNLKGSFTDAYIHQYGYVHKRRKSIKLDENLGFFTNKESGLDDILTEYMEASKDWQNVYLYQKSFVSLISPLALNKTIKIFKKKEQNPRYNLQNFNKIFVLSITDDADAVSDKNDQWLTDYKTIKKYPKLLKEINDVISSLVTSPFNLTQKPFARFVPVKNMSDNYWKILLYRYETFQSLPDTLKQANLLDLKKMDDVKQLRVLQNTINGDSIELISLQTIKFNDSIYRANYTFDDIISLDLKPNKFLKNNLTVEGFAQVVYEDSVLGKKRKKIYFKQNFSYYSSVFYSSLYGLFILLFLIFLFYIFQKQLIVITPTGSVTFRRGFFLFSKTKKQNILMLVLDGQQIVSQQTCKSFLSYLFVNNTSNIVFNTDNSGFEMLILSRKSFQVSNPTVRTELYKKQSDKVSTGETQEMKKMIKKYRGTYFLRFVQSNPEKTVTIDGLYNIVKSYVKEVSLPDNEAKNKAMVSKFFIENKKLRKNSYYFIINEIGNKIFYNFVRFCAKNKQDIRILITYQQDFDDADIQKEFVEIKRIAKKYHLKLHKDFIYEKDSTFNKQLSNLTTSVYPLFIAVLPDNEELKEKDGFMVYNPLKETNQKVYSIPEIPDDGKHYHLYHFPNFRIYDLPFTERLDFQNKQILSLQSYVIDLTDKKINFIK